MWEVEYSHQFHDWWLELTELQQDALAAGVEVLGAKGPNLGRPLVDLIKGSRRSNMKELRVAQAGALRVLIAFDPDRNTILLLGGNKTGTWNEWYKTAIPTADGLYDEHLATIANEKDT